MIEEHEIVYGDTLTPIGATLKQKNTSGTLVAKVLTGLTVKAMITDTKNTTIVAETTTGVTVVDADAGQVTYDVQTTQRLLPGEYFLYFRLYSGSERDTYPTKPHFKLIVTRVGST